MYKNKWHLYLNAQIQVKHTISYHTAIHRFNTSTSHNRFTINFHIRKIPPFSSGVLYLEKLSHFLKSVKQIQIGCALARRTYLEQM